MARINPDPYAGGHLFALVNRVTGLLDNEEEVKATVRALEEDGVATDDIDVFVGEQGAGASICPDASTAGSSACCGRSKPRWETSAGPTTASTRPFARERPCCASRCTKRAPRRLVRSGSSGRSTGTRSTTGEPGDLKTWRARLRAPSVHSRQERILGENEHAVWIHDAHPVSPGHSLVVPKRHVESFFETTPAERDAMLSLLDGAREHVCRNHAPNGYNIGINEGPGAGQTVPHLHVHLIPRFPGDSKDPRGGVRWVIPERADYWS